MLVVAGCGKKADPFIPKKKVSQVIRSLNGQYLDGQIVLKGRVMRPGTWRSARSREIRLKVDYSRYGIGHGPCQDCPVDFKKHEMILARISQEGNLVARWPVTEGKGLYVFKLRVMGDDGGLGPGSEIVRVIVP